MNRRQFLAAAAISSLATVTRANPPARLRVAVVGHTGRGNYGHGLDTVWFALPQTEIVAVADADGKGREAAQKRLKLAESFADYRAMLAAAKADIVAICPRFVDEHRDMALAAIEAGARGIYMEKPFCRTPAEADEIVAACQQRNVKLALAHRNRYHPAIPVVAQLVREGAIGRLLEIRARGKEDRRGGAEDLWVLGSHDFNLIHFLAGPPRACSAVMLQEGRPATKADVREGAEGLGPFAGNELHARYEMESGLPAYFDSIQDAGAKSANFGLQLIGNEGLIDIRIDTEPIAHLVAGCPFLPSKTPRPWVPISSAGPGRPEPVAETGRRVASHETAARDLVAAISEDRQPLCSAEDGRVVVEMIAAVFASHRLNGARVTWPLRDRGNALEELPA